MCLLLSFGCCGSSGRSASPSPVKKLLEVKPADQELEQDQDQDHVLEIQLQQPAATITSQSDLQLSSVYPSRSVSLSRSDSLPLSMSLSLRPIPLPRTNSSKCSSWGRSAEEEFCDMDEYEERTDWWLHCATANDLNLKGD